MCLSPTLICLKAELCFSKCFSCEHDDSVWASINLGVVSLMFAVLTLTSIGESSVNCPVAVWKAGSNFNCSHYHGRGMWLVFEVVVHKPGMCFLLLPQSVTSLLSDKGFNKIFYTLGLPLYYKA